MTTLSPAPDDAWGRFVGRAEGVRELWVRPGHLAERHEAIELISPRGAMSTIARWADEDFALVEGIHRRGCDSFGRFEDGASGRDPEEHRSLVLRELAEAFESRRLVLHATTRAHAPGPPPIEPPTKPVSPRPPQRPKATTWVEVVLETAAGRRLAGEAVRLTTPTGQVVHDRLNDAGLLRLESIDPGVCDVTFPEIDGREWGLGAGPWSADGLRPASDPDRTLEAGPRDCFSSIAASAGFRDVATVFGYVDNALLRKKRPNPNLLAPGDVIVVPGLRERVASAPTTIRSVFTVVESPTRLRIRFLGLRPQRYRLLVGGAIFSGEVAPGATIDHPIPPAATSGELVLESPAHLGSAQRWALQLGALDPVEVARGERGRLSNLAFPPGPIEGEDEERTRRAEVAFAVWDGARFDRSKLGKRHDGGG